MSTNATGPLPSGARVASVVEVGRVIQFTEEDRRQIHHLAGELVYAVEHRRGNVAQLTLALFKVTQRAVRRCHD